MFLNGNILGTRSLLFVTRMLLLTPITSLYHAAPAGSKMSGLPLWYTVTAACAIHMHIAMPVAGSPLQKVRSGGKASHVPASVQAASTTKIQEQAPPLVLLPRTVQGTLELCLHITAHQGKGHVWGVHWGRWTWPRGRTERPAQRQGCARGSTQLSPAAAAALHRAWARPATSCLWAPPLTETNQCRVAVAAETRACMCTDYEYQPYAAFAEDPVPPHKRPWSGWWWQGTPPVRLAPRTVPPT